MHTPQYNAGYTAACNDSKHIFIWDNTGAIWEGFYDKYGSLTNNTQWMQGYRDGAICNDNAGFSIGCDEKQRHLIPKDENDMYMVSPGHDKDWNLGFYDSTLDTSFCPEPNPR